MARSLSGEHRKECVKWFYELLREHAGGTFDEKQADGPV